MAFLDNILDALLGLHMSQMLAAMVGQN